MTTALALDTYVVDQDLSLELRESVRDLQLVEILPGTQDLARQLNAFFGASVTGKIAGYQDPRIAYRWARENGPVPAKEALRRLYAAYRIWTEVTQDRTHDASATWFIAPHPELDEEQPLNLMMQGRFAEVGRVTGYVGASPAMQIKNAPADVEKVSALWHELSLTSICEAIRTLAERFGAPAVSRLAGEANLKAAYRWVKDEGKLPSGEAARRLLGVYRVVTAFDEVLSATSARAWFFAANHGLTERSPLNAVCDGDLDEFLDAANQLLHPLNKVRNKK